MTIQTKPKLAKILSEASVRQKKFKRRLALAATAVGAAAILSACGGGKVIQTQDESADYKSARALPPLRKPSKVATAEPAPQPVQIEPSITAAPTATSAESSAADVASSETLNVPISGADETLASESSVAANDSVAGDLDTAPVTTLTVPATAQISTSILNEGGYAKLSIDAEFDDAWTHLTDVLVDSELTVFSRNKTAARVSIGCAEIGNEAAVEVKRSGGWSIFNRRKASAAEYCALQAESNKGVTIVSVLDRAGQEVSADIGQLILNRIVK